MNSPKKNARICLKKYQTNIFKPNQINKNETKFSRIFNKINDREKKYLQKKIFSKSNTFNEYFNISKSKSISNLTSSNKRFKEYNNKKLKNKILFEKIKNINPKKNVIMKKNQINLNRKNNIHSSNIFPIFINQRFKKILKKNKSNHKLKNPTLTYIGNASKKSFQTQKNKNTISNIPIIKKSEENKFKIKNISKNIIKYSLSKINFNKNSTNTQSNKRKKNLEINARRSLNFIFTKIRKIKSNKDYLRHINNISISNSRESMKLFKNRFTKMTSKISLNSSDYKSSSKGKNEDNDDTYFKNSEIIRTILTTSNEKSQQRKRVQKITKIYQFNIKTEISNTFNYLDKNFDINQKSRNLKISKESFITINNNKNEKGKKTIYIIKPKYKKIKVKTLKSNLTYNLNKMKFITKNKKLKTLTNNLIKKGNLTINKELDSSEKDKHQMKNKDIKFGRNKIKYLRSRMKIENLKTLNKREMKNKLNEILGYNNLIKIIFSFCEGDINLLNKISIISKDIYKKIKPFIYKKISSMIYKYNSNIDTKNKIKKYIMKHRSLFKLSSSLLYIRYNDLLFESNKYDNEIKKDLTRTFPDNILFKYGNIYYNKLYHILTAYANLNKNIGYNQGINYIAAHILYIFENEMDELIFLDALINKLNLDKILDNNLNNEFYEKIFRNINSFILKQMPKLDKFLSDIKLNIEFFTTNWILTLFGDSIDNEFLVIIWDYMIIFGWKFIKYFILNILLKSENDILNSTENNLTFIKKNLLRKEKFRNNSDKIVRDTEQMMINDDNII